jgi:hypothetical protein
VLLFVCLFVAAAGDSKDSDDGPSITIASSDGMFASSETIPDPAPEARAARSVQPASKPTAKHSRAPTFDDERSVLVDDDADTGSPEFSHATGLFSLRSVHTKATLSLTSRGGLAAAMKEFEGNHDHCVFFLLDSKLFVL